MNAKENAIKLVNNLDANANWADVKEVVMNEYKKETDDSTADAIAAVILCVVFAASCILWISGQ
jgi:hypothetical protein